MGAAGRLTSAAVEEATGGKSAGIPREEDAGAFLSHAFSFVERENLNVDLGQLDALEKVVTQWSSGSRWRLEFMALLVELCLLLIAGLLCPDLFELSILEVYTSHHQGC